MEYHEGYKLVLFKCDWVKVTQNGIHVDEESNLRMVNLSNMISFDLLDDEPFILAKHARQVLYSKDPKVHNWHIVLDVPPKIYVKDEPWLLTEPPDVTISNIESSSVTHFIEDKLIDHNSSDIGVIVEKVKKRKSKKTLKRYYYFILFYYIF